MRVKRAFGIGGQDMIENCSIVFLLDNQTENRSLEWYETHRV